MNKKYLYFGGTNGLQFRLFRDKDAIIVQHKMPDGWVESIGFTYTDALDALLEDIFDEKIKIAANDE